MIMLSHEVKLKLQELAKAVKEAEPHILNAGYYSLNIIDAAKELCKLLPPEVTEGATTKCLTRNLMGCYSRSQSRESNRSQAF